MSQILRANEYVKIEVHFSYKVFVLPMLFMSIGILLFLMVLSGAVDGQVVKWFGRTFKMTTICTAIGILLFIPYIYKRLDNRLKIYAITNQRVYIRRGIINIREKDIPLPQINDVQISQSIVQRLFGAADVVIQVGNDESKIFIEDINRPREFRDTVINAIYDLKKEDEMMQKAQQQEMEAKQQYQQQQYREDSYSRQQYSQPQYSQQQYSAQPYSQPQYQQPEYPQQQYSPPQPQQPQYPQQRYSQSQQPQYPQQQYSQPQNSYNQSYQDDTPDYDDDYDTNSDYDNEYEKPFDPDGGL